MLPGRIDVYRRQEVESVTGRWIEVENPSHRGKLAGKAPKGGAQDVDLAVKAAQKAFDAWSRMNPRDRGDLLRKVGDELEKHVEEVAYTIASENGNAVRTQAARRGEKRRAALPLLRRACL
jgi:betaine-aldehyde dehydrogenase